MAVIIAAALIIFCLVKAYRYDGEPPCKPEDCKTCPFPRCSKEEREKHTRK